MSGICPTRLTSHRTSWQTGKKYLFQGLYDSEKHLVKLLLAETQKVVEKTQIEFNKELHEKYPDSFREEKLLIEQRNGKIKKQLETKRVRNWIKFKSNKHISVVPILERSLHIFYLLKEKKEMYHRKTLFSLTMIKAKILPSKENLKLLTDNPQQ